MTQEHPITPPPELVEEWRTAPEYASGREMLTMASMTTRRLQEIADQAARWGADQQLRLDAEQINQAWQKGADMELEACCELLDINGCPGRWIDMLRAARRPKPPSLKAGAIEVLDELDGLFELPAGHYNTILRALEQLDDSL